MRSGRLATCIALVLACPSAWAQGATSSTCGDRVVVQRGDTLSRIAARCDVSEGSLITGNPGIEGSGDMKVGATLHTGAGAPAQTLGTKLNHFATEANSAIGSLADKVGASAQDLLDKNPDLKSRLDRLGSRIGLTSGTTASLSVSPQSVAAGTPVTISAIGLPKDSSVSIGAGPPGSAYEALRDIRTSSSGALETSIQVPDWAAGDPALVFVIAGSDGTVDARSGTIRITR